MAEVDLQSVVTGNTAFGIDLYQKLKVTNGNLFFSPYSISSALAMTYSGARSITEKEMATALHFSLDQQSLHASFRQLQAQLDTIRDKKRIELSVANSLWAQQNYKFLDSFMELNKQYYDAELRLVDFEKQTETARKTINTRVEDETQKKIVNLIPRGMVGPTTRLVLCNAIYFKGTWCKQFDKSKTVDSPFHLSVKKSVDVPMMNRKLPLKFMDFGTCHAIELPYEGNEVSMLLFLPKKIDGISQLENKLNSDTLTYWINNLTQTYESEISLSIPRFKTTRSFDLKQELDALGMHSAFAAADFSGMTGNKDLFIGAVIHKAFIEVNEQGTEAAAATAVLMKGEAGEPLVFRVDHPFLFLIRENSTGSILFMGRIVDPTK